MQSEAGRFRRLGAETEITANVRWISATNEDLEEKIERGEMLEDFYYRLNQYRIQLPPVRERLEDLPQIADALLRRFCAEIRTEVPQLSDGALDPLQAHSWPGNVRELDNVLRYAVILCGGELLTVDLMRRALEAQGRGVARASRSRPAGNSPDGLTIASFLGGDVEKQRTRLVDSFDRLSVQRALEKRDGNITRAAKDLGYSRDKLYRMISRLGLRPDGRLELSGDGDSSG